MARSLLSHCYSWSVTIDFIACAATAGGHHAFACLTCALEIKEWFSRLTLKVVPVATLGDRLLPRVHGNTQLCIPPPKMMQHILCGL